jgi:hypothetical protein
MLFSFPGGTLGEGAYGNNIRNTRAPLVSIHVGRDLRAFQFFTGTYEMTTAYAATSPRMYPRINKNESINYNFLHTQHITFSSRVVPTQQTMRFTSIVFSTLGLLASVEAGTRIMPLGDSITGSPGCWRAILWNRLINSHYTGLNMVGTLPTTACGISYDG